MPGFWHYRDVTYAHNWVREQLHISSIPKILMKGMFWYPEVSNLYKFAVFLRLLNSVSGARHVWLVCCATGAISTEVEVKKGTA